MMKPIFFSLALIFAPLAAAQTLPIDSTTATGTATSAGQQPFDLRTLTINSATTSAADFRGILVNLNVETDANVTKLSAASSYSYHNGDGHITEAIYGFTGQTLNYGAGNEAFSNGVMGGVRQYGTGHVLDGRGVSGLLLNMRPNASTVGVVGGAGVYGETGNRFGGAMSAPNAGHFVVANMDGSIHTATVARLEMRNVDAIQYAYGLRMDWQSSGGDEAYLIYLNEPQGAAPTWRWAVYSRATWPSYFAGDIRVGSPSAPGLQAQINALLARVAALEAAQ